MESDRTETFMLPVNPASIGYSQNTNNSYVKTATGAERVVPGQRSMREYTIESYFPADSTTQPISLINRLQNWASNNKVIKFYVQGSNINTNVLISSLDWEYKGGVPDIYYTLQLKEYIPLKSATVISSSSSSSSGKKPSTTTKRPTASKPKKPKTYTVKKGDTLWAISKKYYGDGTKWKSIHTKNKKVIGSNPNKLKIGQKLVMP